VSDEDAVKYIKIFTFLDKKTIDDLISEHQAEPHLRILQKRLAEEITAFVHSKEDLEAAIIASNILFGKSTSEDLKKLSERDFFDIFEGVPMAKVSKADFEANFSMIDALAAKTNFLPSNGEAKRELKANAISINKEKVQESYQLSQNDLINGKYLLIGKGKKNNYILVVE
jgi:tyrosyl-tRNA synthetase